MPIFLCLYACLCLLASIFGFSKQFHLIVLFKKSFSNCKNLKMIKRSKCTSKTFLIFLSKQKIFPSETKYSKFISFFLYFVFILFDFHYEDFLTFVFEQVIQFGEFV